MDSSQYLRNKQMDSSQPLRNNSSVISKEFDVSKLNNSQQLRMKNTGMTQKLNKHASFASPDYSMDNSGLLSGSDGIKPFKTG